MHSCNRDEGHWEPGTLGCFGISYGKKKETNKNCNNITFVGLQYSRNGNF